MKSLGVRKGAWSGEEDLLLRRCIELHGEGKWNLVPERAGLNRCRKSCRLRWLNYLQPNLNREEFKDDETDLIIKMHKLLGNRWSLIAGRLPGRTANDIKNYWNSHLSKKLSSKPNETPQHQPGKQIDEVIRPQPRFYNSKAMSQGLNSSNPPENQQQQEQQKGPCILTHRQQQNMWSNELILEDDKDSTRISCDTNDERIMKDHTMEGRLEAMDPQSVNFDCSALEWDDVLNMNDWLMEF